MKKGFYTALGTPTDENGAFVEAGMANQIAQQLDAGASGLLVMGSMGKEAFIRNSEYAKVARGSAKAAAGAVPVLVGVTDVSIGRVMDRIDSLKGIEGIDGVVTTVPYYSTCTQADIFDFYNEIAKQSPWPVYLYDLAVVTKTATLPSTVQKLWKNPNIKGIKSGNLVTQRTLLLAEDRPADFSMMFSNIDEFDIAYHYGIDKNLDGMFACTPKTAKRLYAALEAGEMESAARYLNGILSFRDLMRDMPCLMTAFSHAMNMLGCEGYFAVDYQQAASGEDIEKVAAKLKELGEL